MKLVFSSCFALLCLTFAYGNDNKSQEDIIEQLNCLSCTIRAGNAQGSSTVVKVGDYDMLWTAGHVVKGLRRTREAIDPKTGTRRTIVEFDPVKIVQEFLENGERIEERILLADVIKYSDHENGEDLALLKVRRKNAFNCSTKFYLGNTIPKIGSRVIHVGSLTGQFGSNSVTTGDYSAVGRLYENKVYDQVSSPSFPGSSGGGVYLTDGRYVGMLVRGSGETFGLIVPVRRMKDWATKAGVVWAIDSSIKPPSDDDLKKIPIEDIGASWLDKVEKLGPPKPIKYPFLIKFNE